MQADTKDYLERARLLLVTSWTGALEITSFETQFLAMYSELPTDVPEHEADALDQLFWAVERFVSEPSLRDDGDLDEPALKRAIANCLETMGHTGDAA